MVATGYSVARVLRRTRWAQSIAMPHGRLVGGPYSSWLKKLPRRADRLHHEQAGRDRRPPTSQNDWCQRRVMYQAAMVPVMIPP